MKKTILDYDIKNKKVIIRCDLNVPIKDNVILDDTRIKASLKTIRYVIDNGGAAIILSHLGKVKERSDLEKNNLYIVSIRLRELLGIDVKFSNDTKDKKYDSFLLKVNKSVELIICVKANGFIC